MITRIVNWIGTISRCAVILISLQTPARAASSNAELASFEANVGFFFPIALTPAFTLGTTNYSGAVTNRDETVTVRAIAASPVATMQWRLNGGSPLPLQSNATSRVATLLVGTNQIEVEVTAEDGVTRKSYILTLVRAAVPPEAVTMEATPADGMAVTLGATAFPRGVTTVCWFEWGPVGSPLSNITTATILSQVNGPALVSATVSNIPPNSEHAFTVVASNSAGFIRGEPRRFVRSFTEVTTPFPVLHEAAAAWGDYDNDGRLDVLLAGRSTNGPVTRLWRNTASGFVDSGFVFPGVCEGAVAWADYDNDGRLDFALSGFSGHDTNFAPVLVAAVFRNTGSGFTNILAGLPGVSHGSLAWADYDRDGRTDLLLCGEARFASAGFIPLTQIWRNTGTGFAESAIGLTGIRYGAAAWGDYDNDGRPDILLAGRASSGPVAQVWHNTGSGFALLSAGLPGVEQASASWGDYDSDGRLDFHLSGLSTNGTISQVWHNAGIGFTNSGAQQPGLRDGATAWGDTDNDGRANLLATGTPQGYPRYAGTTVLWSDAGAGWSNGVAVLPSVGSGAVALGDYDSDGRLDALLASPRAGTIFAEPTNAIYVAIRGDGVDGTGTKDDPRNGNTAAVVHQVLDGVNGRKVVFGEGHYPLTNFVSFEDNNVVEGAGWGRTVFVVSTNVTAGYEFTTFYPASENSTNNIFRGFTIDVQAHLNKVFTNSMNGLTTLGSGNLIEIEVINPKGNWLSERECFPIRAWPPHIASGATNIGRNVIRSRVISTNIDYPYDYITAITTGGRRTNSEFHEFDLMENCTVIGRSRTNHHAAYSLFGRSILRNSFARSVRNAIYHETQSGGAQDGDNGQSFAHGNTFEDVTRGVFIIGTQTNADYQVTHNRIVASHAGVLIMYSYGGHFSNVVVVANTIHSVGGANLVEGGLVLQTLSGGVVAQNIVGEDVANNPVAQVTNLIFIGNRTIGGTPIIADTPPGLRTNQGNFQVKGVWTGTGFDESVRPAALWRGVAPVTNSRPTVPTGLVTEFHSNQVALKWSAASDTQTATSGLTYHVRAGLAPGADDLIAGHSSADGFRRVVERGNAGSLITLSFTPPSGTSVYWSVQAVDAAVASSMFAPEQGFVFLPPSNTVAGDLDGNGVVSQGELNQVVSNYWTGVSPEYASISAATGTIFDFQLTNLASLTLFAQASTNLMDWQALGPVPLHYRITDPDATNHDQRFYRLVLP